MFTTRRALLVGAAALAAAGCTRETAAIIIADPDLSDALRTARALAHNAEALGYSDIAQDHLTHAATLERLLLPNVVAEETVEAFADAAELAAAEAEASTDAVYACLGTDTDFAVVFGEIAASRAAHAAVLA